MPEILINWGSHNDLLIWKVPDAIVQPLVRETNRCLLHILRRGQQRHLFFCCGLCAQLSGALLARRRLVELLFHRCRRCCGETFIGRDDCLLRPYQSQYRPPSTSPPPSIGALGPKHRTKRAIPPEPRPTPSSARSPRHDRRRKGLDSGSKNNSSSGYFYSCQLSF